MGRASFQFEDELLSHCSLYWLQADEKSHLSRDAASRDSRISCLDLYGTFTAHFQRPSLTREEEEQFLIGGQLKSESRFEAFLRSVELVTKHDSARSHHNLTLNRFSDMLHHELPLMDQPSSHWRDFFHGDADAPFIPLDGTTLSAHANKLLKRRRFNDGGIYDWFRSSWWWIGGGRKQYSGKKRDKRKHHNLKKSRDNDFIVSKNSLTGIESRDTADDEWEHHLDWATKDNPDGVPIVHGAVDQGMCGSCWAIAGRQVRVWTSNC